MDDQLTSMLKEGATMGVIRFERASIGEDPSASQLETNDVLTSEKLPCSEWDQLEAGQRVLIQRSGEQRVAGKVDIRAQDGSIFWAWLEGGRGRVAVYADEGTCVWVPNSPLR